MNAGFQLMGFSHGSLSIFLNNFLNKLCDCDFYPLGTAVNFLCFGLNDNLSIAFNQSFR